MSANNTFYHSHNSLLLNLLKKQTKKKQTTKLKTLNKRKAPKGINWFILNNPHKSDITYLRPKYWKNCSELQFMQRGNIFNINYVQAERE